MIIHEFIGRGDLERQMWVLSFRPNFIALNILEPLQNIRFVLYKEKKATLISLTSNCFLVVRRCPKEKETNLFHKACCICTLTHTKKLLFLTWWSKVNEMVWPCFREQLFWSRGIPFYCLLKQKTLRRVF